MDRKNELLAARLAVENGPTHADSNKKSTMQAANPTEAHHE